jgi:hypothetical protein
MAALILCTVPDPTPSSAAILWTPFPPSLRARRVDGGIQPWPAKHLAGLLHAGKASVDALLNHRPLELGEGARDLKDQLAHLGTCSKNK